MATITEYTPYGWRVGDVVLTEAGRVAEVTRFIRARDSRKWTDAAYVRYAGETEEHPLFEYVDRMERLRPTLYSATPCAGCQHGTRLHEDWLGYRGYCREAGCDCPDYEWPGFASAEEAEAALSGN